MLTMSSATIGSWIILILLLQYVILKLSTLILRMIIRPTYRFTVPSGEGGVYLFLLALSIEKVDDTGNRTLELQIVYRIKMDQEISTTMASSD